MLQKILFLIVVFLTNIIQCITGFAGTVLAMPFSLMLVGYDVAKPILNVLGFAASLFIVIKEFRSINKKEFGKIVGFMGLGMVLSHFIMQAAASYEGLLYKVLGVLVIVIALFNAYKFYAKKESRDLTLPVAILLLIASGVVHGLFVCGGALVVTYVNAVIKDKNEFRATLSAVWLVLNFIIMINDITAGHMTQPTLILMAVSLTVLALALLVGNLIYKKMSREVFLQLTYALMFISGVSLLIK